MNEAFEKNCLALAKVLGSADLAQRLQRHRIGIWSPQNSATVSASLIAECLGDTLARLWQILDVSGSLIEPFSKAAARAARSASYPSEIKAQWNPPYDFVI